MTRVESTFFTIICALVLATAWGCRADDEIKQGVEGEVCTVNDFDCRDGNVCDRGFCRASVIDGSNCEAMCERISLCDAEEPDCLEACFATTNGACSEANPCPWSDEVVDTFGTCIVEELTCEQIRTENAQGLCLARLPVDERRADVCDDLTQAAITCNPDADTGDLDQRCDLLARTATDAGFQRADTCFERVVDGFCAEIEECLNSVFVLNPNLDLGDSMPPRPE